MTPYTRAPTLGTIINVRATNRYPTFITLDLTGELIAIASANVTPNAAAMATLFARNKQASALAQPSVPTRASKYDRWIVRVRSGRVFVFPFNPASYNFYPGSTREER